MAAEQRRIVTSAHEKAEPGVFFRHLVSFGPEGLLSVFTFGH